MLAFFLSSSFGPLFSERRECLFLFARTGVSFFVFYPSFVVYVVRSMIFRAFTDDDDDDDDDDGRSLAFSQEIEMLRKY